MLDSHTHTTGQGVPITPQAININADLPMNGNNLTTTRSVRFSPQSGTITDPADLGALYENGVDLYYVDGAGNQVRITQGGSVTGATGTITGLPSGTASAAFAGSTFTFQSATNTPALMNFGPITIGQPVPSGFGVTISPSVSQASNYNLTLPIALPSATSAVMSDSSGNLSFLRVFSTSYTPTFSSPLGGTGFSAGNPFIVMQIGNMIHVAGNVSYTPTAGITSVSLTLPISRTDGVFTQSFQAVGNTTATIVSPLAVTAGTANAVVGDTLVTAGIVASSGNTSGSFNVTFMYSLTNI